MYFYPVLNPFHNISTASQKLMHVWIEGIDRHIRLHLDVIGGSCKTQLNNVQALVKSNGGTLHVAKLLSCIPPQSSQLMNVAVRSGEITADTQRQAFALLEPLVRELSMHFSGYGGSPAQSRPVAMRDKAAVRRKKRTV